MKTLLIPFIFGLAVLAVYGINIRNKEIVDLQYEVNQCQETHHWSGLVLIHI